MLLQTNKDRLCTFFAIDYDFRPVTKFYKAVDFVLEKYTPAPTRSGFGNLAADFQWPSEHRHIVISVKRIAVGTLGLEPWLDNLDSHLDLVVSLLELLEVTKIKRIGFKIVAFLPLAMDHAEACDLMFSTFLAEKQQISELFGNSLDPLLHLEGAFDDFNYSLDVAAMTPEQASKSFLALPNLDKFVESKYLNQDIKVFHDRLNQGTCMFFDMDMHKTDIEPTSARVFARGGFANAEAFAEKCMKHLRTQPISSKK